MVVDMVVVMLLRQLHRLLLVKDGYIYLINRSLLIIETFSLSIYFTIFVHHLYPSRLSEF